MNRSYAKRSVSKFPRHHRGNRYSLYRLLGITGFIVICGLMIIIGTQYIQQLQVSGELDKYEARIEEYETRGAVLSTEIEWLQNFDYIEVVARKRLGLVKPDEIVFQFED